jgi:ATP-dependent DNA helicase RecG
VERLHGTRRWENEPVPDGVTVSDLDADEIRLTLENAISLGRLDAPKNRGIKFILQGFELFRDGQLLNAAVALFGKSQRLCGLYPQFGIRLGCFRGVNRLADFTDNRQYWGHAFDLLRRGKAFLRDHVPIAGRVLERSMLREDRPAYPPRATREALANAICHRDYIVPGGAVVVAMYDDHPEIVSPGGFHFGIEPAKLTVPHESKPWNPIIANVFHRAGIIKRWGTGTLKILDWSREFDCPVPEWKEQADNVYVTFKPAASFEQQPVGPKLQLESQLESQLKSQLESLPGRVLRILSKGPLGKTLLAERLGQKQPSGQLHAAIRKLLADGFIEPTLPDKPQSRLQRYRLEEKGREWVRIH